MEYKSSLDGTLFTGLVMDTAPDEITSATTANSSAAATTFRIQIAASTKKMALKPYNFKGLTDVSRIKTGSLYRYYYFGQCFCEIAASYRTSLCPSVILLEITWS